MAYTLNDLLNPPDEKALTTTMLGALSSLGFPVTNWAPGGAGRTLVQGFARVLADGLALASNVARGSLLDLAPGTDTGSPGDWLSLLSKSAFRLDRYPSRFAKVKVRLTVASGAGPYTVTPGQLWVQNNAGRRYNSANTTNVTLSAGPSTTDVEFRAENPGAAYNLAIGAALSLVGSPLPGVTAATVESTGGSGTAMTEAGADTESDSSLRARCRLRWQTIGLQKTSLAYDAIVRDPATGTTDPVTRVRVVDTNPRGPGTVDVWIAGASGPLSTPNETLVRAFVAARKSVTADLQVQNASSVVVNVTATIYVRGNAAAKAEAETRVTAAINAVPIGGVLYKSQIIEELMAPSGVYNATFDALDLVLGLNQVATVGTITITQVNS